MALGETLVDIGTGLGSLYEIFGSGSKTPTGTSEEAARLADPFASQRPQYQTMLQNLMTNPDSFMLSPAAKGQMDLGLQNVARQGAAAGFLNSGNILGALTKYGQNLASQDYWKQLEALTTLSGATTGNPAQAGIFRANRYPQQLNAGKALGSVLPGLINAIPGAANGVGGIIGSAVGGIGSLWDSISNSDLFGGVSSMFEDLAPSELDFNIDDTDMFEFDAEDFTFDDFGDSYF